MTSDAVIRLANDDRREDLARSMDTSDLLEALAICGIVYSQWRDSNWDIYRHDPASPCYLRQAAVGKYVEISGFLPEPQTSFNGKLMLISRVAALAIGIERPITPLMLTLWRGGIDIDGADMPTTIGDFAECLFEYIAIERDERTQNAEAVMAIRSRMATTGTEFGDRPVEAGDIINQGDC